jgi:hypothetical protein
MKYLFFTVFIGLTVAQSVVASVNSFSKCKITISKIGSPDITNCNAVTLIEKCIKENPNEPNLCSTTGKLPLQIGSVKISAEIMNGFLSLWINTGDDNWMITKVIQQAIVAPLSLNILTPARTASQIANGENAFITCSIYQDGDSNKNCE